MSKADRFLNDGLWLTFFQFMAAAGQLVGIRLLTEVLPPSEFGIFSLWLGGVTLVAGGLANPTMQALLRYFPEYSSQGQGALVLWVVHKQLTKLIIWLSPLFLICFVFFIALGQSNLVQALLVIFLIFTEIARLQSLSLLNAVSLHRLYGFWLALDTCFRPLMAWWLIRNFTAHTNWALFGYAIVSLCLWAVFRQFNPSYKQAVVASFEDKNTLLRTFWKYTLPLLPLGLLGWITGMADRYIIGTFMTSAEVGIYVAVYGLGSRPMLMLGRIVETVIRPIYQNNVVSSHLRAARKIIGRWVLLIMSLSLFAFVVTWFFHPLLAKLFLGEKYRHFSYLLPWILAGYIPLILAQIAGRVCYANDATRSVLLMEGIAAAIALTAGIAGVYFAGLNGAVAAVFVYHSVQMFIAFYLAKPFLTVQICGTGTTQ